MADTKSSDETQASSTAQVLALAMWPKIAETQTVDDARLVWCETIVKALDAAGYLIVPRSACGWQIVEEATAAVRAKTGHNGGTGSQIFRQELAALIDGSSR